MIFIIDLVYTEEPSYIVNPMSSSDPPLDGTFTKKCCLLAPIVAPINHNLLACRKHVDVRNVHDTRRRNPRILYVRLHATLNLLLQKLAAPFPDVYSYNSVNYSTQFRSNPEVSNISNVKSSTHL